MFLIYLLFVEWCVVKFVEDTIIHGPLRPCQLEDEDGHEVDQDVDYRVGKRCMVEYGDDYYMADILSFKLIRAITKTQQPGSRRIASLSCCCNRIGPRVEITKIIRQGKKQPSKRRPV